MKREDLKKMKSLIVKYKRNKEAIRRNETLNKKVDHLILKREQYLSMMKPLQDIILSDAELQKLDDCREKAFIRLYYKWIWSIRAICQLHDGMNERHAWRILKSAEDKLTDNECKKKRNSRRK